MPAAFRAGIDVAQAPCDTHLKPCCPHPARGCATSGSRDVLINGRPAARVGDGGPHAACCGPNRWTIATGSRTVLVGGRPAARRGDLARHCGGIGVLATGSIDVWVGG
jgi:uncharacterized Zn-binding protein involved in type VI secretion